jgi:effector-binding domain-containing protein
MRVLKIFLVVVLLLVGGVFAYGLTLPNASHVQRSTTIDAPACTIYAQLDNFRNFNSWSPWLQRDPNAKITIEGPPRGVGAKQSWASTDPQIGSGSQEIVADKGCSELKSRIVFAGFDDNHYIATFTLSPRSQGTDVAWALDGEFGGNIVNQVMSRYFAKAMAKGAEDDFDRGLANLKKVAESLPKTDFAALKAEALEIKPITIAAVAGHSTTESADIGKAYAESYAKIMGFLKANNLSEAGPPLAIARKWDEAAKTFDFDAGIPVDRSDIPPADGEVHLMQTYGGPALKITHTGPYEDLSKTYAMIKAYMEAYGYEKAGDEWEQYVSDPGKTSPAELVTLIYYPVKL